MSDGAVRRPALSTLRRYGWTMDDWEVAGDLQGWTCPICLRPFGPKVRPVIDHEHVRGWKKMPPAQRRLYVRQLVCAHDNHRILGRFMTTEKAERAAAYLFRYDHRGNPDPQGPQESS